MSLRTGIEPLTRLKFSWNFGSIISLPNSFWPASTSGFFDLNMAKLSTMKRKLSLPWPGGLAQT